MLIVNCDENDPTLWFVKENYVDSLTIRDISDEFNQLVASSLLLFLQDYNFGTPSATSSATPSDTPSETLSATPSATIVKKLILIGPNISDAIFYCLAAKPLIAEFLKLVNTHIYDEAIKYARKVYPDFYKHFERCTELAQNQQVVFDIPENVHWEIDKMDARVMVLRVQLPKKSLFVSMSTGNDPKTWNPPKTVIPTHYNRKREAYRFKTLDTSKTPSDSYSFAEANAIHKSYS